MTLTTDIQLSISCNAHCINHCLQHQVVLDCFNLACAQLFTKQLACMQHILSKQTMCCNDIDTLQWHKHKNNSKINRMGWSLAPTLSTYVPVMCNIICFSEGIGFQWFSLAPMEDLVTTTFSLSESIDECIK